MGTTITLTHVTGKLPIESGTLLGRSSGPAAPAPERR